ncbi:acyl-CoA-binding domain-containing protein 5-like isoform X2 [Lineus longissimus]|uniref:acyl-CoA-binding domain-containing protein 5-like isoform X2 n=1 Tax=Lineus longissimus TaxID=88925 RepID=UPI00315CE457
MESTAKEKFDAAVNVIKSLPKNGSFQPSHELMLKFYAYYKQATLGPCNIPKPGFWDMVGKAKWDAWHSLGPMGKEDAMRSYVEELKQIIETMPQTQMVADFIEKLGSFYELIDEKQEAAIKAKRDRENLSRALEGMNGDSAQEERVPDLSDENHVDPLVLLDCDKDIDTKADGLSRNGSSDDLHNNNQLGNAELSERLAVKVTRQNGHDDCVDETNIENVLNSEIAAQIITVKAPMTSTPQKPIKKDFEDRSYDRPRGRDLRRRVNGHVSPRSVASDTDSDMDEFCDTSDQLVQIPNLIPARIPDHVTRTDIQSTSSAPPGGTTIQTRADVHHPRPQLLSTTADIASSFQTVDLSNSSLSSTSQEQLLQTALSVSQGSAILDQFLNQTPQSSQPNLQTDSVMNRGGGDNPVLGRPTRSLSSNMTTPAGVPNQGFRHQDAGPTASSSRSLPAGGAGGSGGSSPDQHYIGDVNEQIAVALIRLQQDMNQVLTRLNTLETHAILQRQLRDAEEIKKERNLPSWWPFSNLPGRTIVFILVWPVILQWVLKLIFRRRKPAR